MFKTTSGDGEGPPPGMRHACVGDRTCWISDAVYWHRIGYVGGIATRTMREREARTAVWPRTGDFPDPSFARADSLCLIASMSRCSAPSVCNRARHE
jgi:hypothetical protein